MGRLDAKPLSFVSACAAALALTSARAGADETHDKAVTAFEEGRRFIEAGNCESGITRLRESVALEPSVGACLSLADCYERTDPVMAWWELKEAARLAYLKHDDRFTIAEARATALEPGLPMLRVTVPRATLEDPGFELRLDDKLVDAFLYQRGLLAAEPGKHRLEASAPQRVWNEEVNAAPGAPTAVSVTLAPLAPPKPETRREAPVVVVRPSGSSSLRTAAFMLGGAGVAGIAAGVIFGVVTLNKKSDLQAACGGNVGSCSAPAGSLDAERESARSSAAFSTAGFVFGGAALIGAAALYLAAPQSSAPAAGSLRLVPAVARDTRGLAVVGRW